MKRSDIKLQHEINSEIRSAQKLTVYRIFFPSFSELTRAFVGSLLFIIFFYISIFQPFFRYYCQTTHTHNTVFVCNTKKERTILITCVSLDVRIEMVFNSSIIRNKNHIESLCLEHCDNFENVKPQFNVNVIFHSDEKCHFDKTTMLNLLLLSTVKQSFYCNRSFVAAIRFNAFGFISEECGNAGDTLYMGVCVCVCACKTGEGLGRLSLHLI